MTIPRRAYTLQILQLMGDHEPVLMLGDDEGGYGVRWTLKGQPIEPAIARYLMEGQFIVQKGMTEFGARRLYLTEAGRQLRERGNSWWRSLGLIEKFKTILFG